MALLSENRPEWAVTDMATQMLGAVTVALYTTVPADDVAFIARDSGAERARGVDGPAAPQGRGRCRRAGHVPVVSMAPVGPAKPGSRSAWGPRSRAALPPRRHRRGRSTRAARPSRRRPSALIYTSGTTGEPKGVALTQRNLVANVHAAHERIAVFESDLHLSFLPLSHAFERTAGYTTVLSAGATIAYAESVDTVAKNLPEVRPTMLMSVPRVFEKVHAGVLKSVAEGGASKRAVFAWAVDVGAAVAAKTRAGERVGPLLRAQHALAHRLVFATLHEKLGGRLRFAVSGGAALPAEIGRFFEAAGLTIVEGYGLSETAPVLAANPSTRPSSAPSATFFRA